MAFFNNDDEENKNAQGMNQTSQPEQQEQAPQQLAGSVAGASGGSIPTGAQSQAAPKSTSSGMTGFKTIQQANAGTATNRLNQAASTNVANQAQSAKTAINQASNSFGQKVEQGTLANRGQAVDDVKNVVQQARQVTQANNQIAQPQQSRFQEVINAKYQGPQSLRQSGDYLKASGQVENAQTALDQTENATGRENLLKNLFKNTNYTQGLNKLDAGILNASAPAVQNLQNVAKAQGDISQQLDQAQISSANLATNRAQEIANIRGQARQEFETGKAAEEAATEARLSNVIKDWDLLPNYFKDLIKNKAQNRSAVVNEELAPLQKQYDAAIKDPNYLQKKEVVDVYAKRVAELEREARRNGSPRLSNQLNDARRRLEFYQNELTPFQSAINNYDKQIKEVNNKFNPNAITLNPFEAATLGVQSGEGIYTLGADAIKVAQADKARLISKNEQARQAVLAELAKLDQEGLLNSNLNYADASKAGTQSALDALDLQATRTGLNAAEKNFRDTSEDTDITGTGHKKVSRGGWSGKKTKHYYADVSGNVGDFLEQAGYDLDGKIGGNVPVVGEQLLKKFADADTTTNRSMLDKTDYAKNIAQDAIVGMPTAGTPMGWLKSVDMAQNLLEGIGLGGVSQGIQDVRNTVADPIKGIGGDIGKGIGGMIGGIDAGAMAAFGNAEAKQNAIEDLQNKYKDYLSSHGFDNRFALSNTDAANSRLSALQQLLAKLDKTNT
jgi:hypothetical protein